MKNAADILLGMCFGLDLYVNSRPIESLCGPQGSRPALSGPQRV